MTRVATAPLTACALDSRGRLLSLGLLLCLTLLVSRSAIAGTAIVDLLVLYTPAAAERYSDVDTRISHLINVANQIYSDSDVDMQLRVVHSEQVDYSDKVNSRKALNDLTFASRSDLGRHAAALREEYGADMVVMMRPYVGDSICGLAWIGGNGSGGRFTSRDGDYAFSHVSINCSDYVLAHELGHNMGLQHSRKQNRRGGTFEYSLGHGLRHGFVTVMAYRSAYAGHKIYKFSNPDLLCDGSPCGFDPNGKRASRSADAARSLQVTRHQFAAYSEPATAEPPPTLRLLAPVKKTKLRRGETARIRWEAGTAVEAVDIQYRSYWRAGGQKFRDAEWNTIASDLAEDHFEWVVPSNLPGSRLIKFRVVGKDSSGEEVVWVASRAFKVRKARGVVSE